MNKKHNRIISILLMIVILMVNVPTLAFDEIDELVEIELDVIELEDRIDRVDYSRIPNTWRDLPEEDEDTDYVDDVEGEDLGGTLPNGDLLEVDTIVSRYKVNIGESFEYTINIENSSDKNWEGIYESELSEDLEIEKILIDDQEYVLDDEGEEESLLVINNLHIEANDSIEIKLGIVPLESGLDKTIKIKGSLKTNFDDQEDIDIGKEIEFPEVTILPTFGDFDLKEEMHLVEENQLVALEEGSLIDGEDVIRYTIIAKNAGEENSQIKNIKLKDTLPKAELVEYSLKIDGENIELVEMENGVLEFELESLRDEEIEVSFDIRVTEETPEKFINEFEISGENPKGIEYIKENDLWEDEYRENTVSQSLKLKKGKVALYREIEDTKFNLGDTFTYKLILLNDSNTSWIGRLEDIVSDKLEVLAVKNNRNITWDYGKDNNKIIFENIELESHDKLEIEVKVRIKEGSDLGIVESKTLLQEKDIDGNILNPKVIHNWDDKIEIVGKDGDLRIEKLALTAETRRIPEKTEIRKGDTLFYRIKVWNEGGVGTGFKNIEISDLLISEYKLLGISKIKKYSKVNDKYELVEENKISIRNNNRDIKGSMETLDFGDLLIIDMKVELIEDIDGDIVNEAIVNADGLGVEGNLNQFLEKSDYILKGKIEVEEELDQKKEEEKKKKEKVKKEKETQELLNENMNETNRITRNISADINNSLILNRVEHFSYMNGYPDRTFKPEAHITRGEVAAIFGRLVEGSDNNNVVSKKYTDIGEDFWNYDYINILSSNNILKGYEDGTFRPNAQITRAEFAAITTRFEEVVANSNSFIDIPIDHWAMDYINKATSKGFILGYEDGSFRPDNYISREEAATVVNRLLGRKADKQFIDENKSNGLKNYIDVTEDRWSYYEIYEASNGHDYINNELGAEVWTEVWGN